MVDELNKTFEAVKHILEDARNNAFRAVNSAMVKAYWQIGRVIVEEEQKGKKRAGYGKNLIEVLSKKLTHDYGKGFNERNLWYMKEFYLKFPKLNALRAELSWTHYRLILRVDNEFARGFYLNECINSNWSTRELERQINSLYYERIALSKDKIEVTSLFENGQILNEPKDLMNDPYVLEFLGVKEDQFKEKDLEVAIVDKLKEFLLELGKGFCFIARQKRITIDGNHFYIDLVLYNYILKCFVLIDLKIGKLTHQDIGQMDFYVRYFEKEERKEDDNPTLGMILCSDKNESMVKYTLLDDKKSVFASKYKLYLPTEEELKKEINSEREMIEREKRLGSGD